TLSPAENRRLFLQRNLSRETAMGLLTASASTVMVDRLKREVIVVAQNHKGLMFHIGKARPDGTKHHEDIGFALHYGDIIHSQTAVVRQKSSVGVYIAGIYGGKIRLEPIKPF
ncbi:MAG: hypothetical protein AAGF33_07765, partial [Pseudomonadota bacterium]